jgi:hypothetical protein
MMWPCCCRCSSDRAHACRTAGASSDMLYSTGTPMVRGVFVRDDRVGEFRCERIRERENGDRLVGSRGSWRFRMSAVGCRV